MKNKKTECIKKTLIPASKWNNYHPWPPLGGLRHLIFHAETNGFDKVIKRVGKNILIDEQEFFSWVEEMNKQENKNRREIKNEHL